MFFKKDPLPYEYEEMKISLLFTDDEIRNLINRRKAYEYKINKQLKSVRDFLEYIKYERENVKMINDRNKNKQLQSIKVVVSLCSKRIVSLYEQGISHFPHERKFWENFHKFSSTFKRNEFSSYLTKWIQYHGSDEEVWITVLKWEYEHNEVISVIRGHISEAIQRHPQSSELHATIFRIELNEVSKLTNKSDSFERLQNIYENSKRDIHTIEFLVEILTICEEYQFTQKLQHYIIKDITELFPSHYLTWNTLALRELKGFHMFKIDKNEEKKLSTSTDAEIITVPEKLTIKKRIEFCIKIFQRAGSLLKTETMWTHYIDAMLELNQDLSTQQVLKQKCLLNAYKGGHEAKCLTERQYLDYIDILMDEEVMDNDLLGQIFNQATTMYSNSVDLWMIYMRHSIIQDRREKIFDTFDRALRGLNFRCADQIQLWQILIQYSLTKFDRPSKIVDVYKEAIQQPSPIGEHFKPQYIEWLSIGKNVTEARNVFEEICEIKPYCFQMHKTMLAINLKLLRNSRRVNYSNLDDNIKCTKDCFDITLKIFGNCKPELWVEYIKFQTEYCETKNKNELIEYALLSLDVEYKPIFSKLQNFV